MTNKNYVETQYNSPFILNRADPFICKADDGYYYFTASVPEYDRIVLRRAKNITGLKSAEEKVIWIKHESGIMSMHIWAPELHYINKVWYIYYAAGDIEDIWNIKPYVLTCKTENPYDGEWKELGCMKAASNDPFSFQDFSLDMTVFKHKEEWYCIWAEKVNKGKKISNLYIAKMETPNQLKTAQVLLTSPDYDWERNGFWVNEGPAILKHKNKIILLYSASETGRDYCMGMLSIDQTEDMLNPSAWKKCRYPVMKTDSSKGIFGPGHNSFTKSENGEEDVMSFHARQYDEIIGDPLYDFNRHTYLMKIKWNEEGNPVFGYEAIKERM